MKDQYVGDVNDYRKYALLRALVAGGTTKLGVVWMLTPPDGGNDGKRSSYLNNPSYRTFDSELYDLLKCVAGTPHGQRLHLIETSAIIPKAQFFNEVLTDRLADRLAYFKHAADELADADLVFFDPDNGLDVQSRGKGARHSSKYIFREEIAATYDQGISVLVYQHFPRMERQSFVNRLASELSDLCQDSTIWTFSTPHVVFTLIVARRHVATIGAAARAASSKWPTAFLEGRKRPRNDS